MDIKILYEDKDILAVNKPAGILVHPAYSGASADHKTKEGTLADWVLKKYPETKDVGESMTLKIKNEELKINRSGIVHRLDKETSGVLLIAKNQESYLFLKKQFQGRTIQKIYNAIVWGEIKKDGVVDKPIGRSPQFGKWSCGRGVRGTLREAVTEYRVIKRIILPINADKKLIDSDISEYQESIGGISNFTFLEIKPKTGRTHQIRVHMKYLNHPVLCDKLYAPKLPLALGMDRLALHALSIEFSLQNGKTLKIEAPLPKDIKDATQKS